MRKKIIALLLVVVLAVGMLAACGAPSGTTTPPADSGTTTPAPADKGNAKDVPESIKIGWVAPLTGPLANQTVGIARAIELALPVMNADGGIYFEAYDANIPVEFIMADSESNPTKASEVATKLVTEDKVDILIGEYTPDTINPVSVVGERYKVPTLVSNGPQASWLSAGPYEWSFAMLFDNILSMEEWFLGFDTIETNRKIALCLDSNVDSVLVTDLLKDMAPDYGYEIVDPGRFPEGTTDYSAVIAQMIEDDADIIITCMTTPYEVTLWKQMVQMGYNPKIACFSKGMNLSGDVAQCGEFAWLCCDSQWTPEYPFVSSLLGMDAVELSEDFTATTGEAPDLTIGWDFGMLDVVADVLTRAPSIDKEDIRQAFIETDLDTIYGHVTFNEEHVYTTPVFLGQYISDGEGGFNRTVVNAKYVPELTESVALQPVPWDKING
ncbi:MAG: ABC transporter substrate-binding protein [Oscillospiraceae bacterium]|nr:ABC transporter substrate-binding protein [Oscillospiraceae bacterium]